MHSWAIADVMPFESDLAWAKSLNVPKAGVKRQNMEDSVYNELKAMSFKKPKDGVQEEGAEVQDDEQALQEDTLPDEA